MPDSNANEPASHGYVTYRIIEKTTNGLGDEIENTAHIYFDWNPAIVTNTTYNINDESNAIEDQNAMLNVLIYPNPTNGQVTVQAPLNIESIQVMNINGQTVDQYNPLNTNATFDISNYTAGVYIIKVHTQQGVSINKLIKQ